MQSRILEQIGARPGGIYGRLTDREIYAAMMAREFNLFIGLAEELAETLLREKIDYIVGDAVEGYNPAHDVCHLIALSSYYLRSDKDPLAAAIWKSVMKN